MTSRLALLACLLAACAASGGPEHDGRASAVEVAVAASPAGSAIATGSGSAIATGSAAPAPGPDAGLCLDALGDTLAVLGDPDHPPVQYKQEVFTEICLRLPPLFQRCASPSYEEAHKGQCRPVYTAVGKDRDNWEELRRAAGELMGLPEP